VTEFPRLSLIVSGGNTQLVFSYSVFRHHILGMTVDDAIGEAIDKSARMLNCNWSDSGGLGHDLELLASSGIPFDVNFKSLEVHEDPLCFSFSGLKTALKNFITEKIASSNKADLAATIQYILFGHVAVRLKNCIEMLINANISFKEIALIGGVAGNKYFGSLVQEICSQYKKTLLKPEAHLCTDNATMIGIAAHAMLNSKEYLKFRKNVTRIYPDWDLEELCINKPIVE
jgi:N6-L-threonylcarbamoyladenine synthase